MCPRRCRALDSRLITAKTRQGLIVIEIYVHVGLDAHLLSDLLPKDKLVVDLISGSVPGPKSCAEIA